MNGKNVFSRPPVDKDGFISKSVLNLMWELLRNIYSEYDGINILYNQGGIELDLDLNGGGTSIYVAEVTAVTDLTNYTATIYELDKTTEVETGAALEILNSTRSYNVGDKVLAAKESDGNYLSFVPVAESLSLSTDFEYDAVAGEFVKSYRTVKVLSYGSESESTIIETIDCGSASP